MGEGLTIWLSELRSGRHVQGTSRLERYSGERCCLGVACDAYQRLGPGDLAVAESLDLGVHALSYDSCDSTLPKKVAKWLGIDPWGEFASRDNCESALIKVSLQAKPRERADAYYSLIGLNDLLKYTFNQIADFVEAGGVKPNAQA